jgi:hypothetical protein
MKQIIVFLMSFLFLVSCQKYTQPKLLSLSGEYRIDKITYEKIDNTDTADYMIFYPGDMYINPNDVNPFDTIQVGFSKMAFDYQMFFYNPTLNPDGSTSWGDECSYSVKNESNSYLGTLVININGSAKVFQIIDDGLETLVLRSTGQWAYGSSGSNESITMLLTRVGP